MKNNDTLQKFLFENMSIRGELVHLDTTFKTIMKQHDYPPPIQRLLGETLVIASLLMAELKFKGRLTVQFQGKGTLKLLLAQCNQDLELRGLAQWTGDLQDEDLLADLKQGTLAIIMDPDNSVQRYQGIVEWVGNSLSRSIENYFENSEQLQTRLWIHVTDNQAAGFLLQMMPAVDPKEYSLDAERDWEHVVHLGQTITADELFNLENEVLLSRLYTSDSIRIFEPSDVVFRCTCSAQRGENAILLLGPQEAEEELHENQVIVVKCEFCNSQYTFDRVDVANIFHRNPPPSSSQVH
ncbi:MAG: Hsp33 family molecular chaperone HslO [Gammaproteobacteria bacterium]|nr:Hsp33 family molecular chaperone HslO [Gammaproteobacteria bacterium]